MTEIRQEFLYWFFDRGGDNDKGDYQTDIHGSMPQVHKNFNFQLPFFGFRFNYTRVSMNGYLEFSDPPKHFRYPLSFPIKEWPKKNDPSFIGIFYSKCRIGSLRPDDIDSRKPGVYFRMERDLQARTDQFGVEMRERLMWDIREGVVGADAFVPKHSAVITWKNMSFAGGIDNSLYRVRTNSPVMPNNFRARIAGEIRSLHFFYFFFLIPDKHVSNGLGHGRSVHLRHIQLRGHAVDQPYGSRRRHDGRRRRSAGVRESTC